MSYSNSSLVNYTKISPNQSGARNHSIDTITIHCVVGQCAVETLGTLFANPSTGASSNYGIGYDGRVGLYVEEKDRSWCTSSSSNDNRAITIEVASDSYHPYAITTAAYNTLIKLVADICKRNGISKLVWSTDKNQRMNHLNGCNMTVHRDYANKSCPGDYIYERLGTIASEVNKILGNSSVETDELYRVRKSWSDAESQVGAFTVLENAKSCADSNEGYYVFDSNGNIIYPENDTNNSEVNVYYRAKVGGQWLPEVKNLEDYAGIPGQPITGLAIKVDKGSIQYRVHTNGKWLSYITKYDLNDFYHGYAGNGTPIDCVEIYYYTPDSIRPYKKAYYRVSPVNKGYFSWQIDNSTSNGMDGYAGLKGSPIDRLQIEIK